MKNRKLLFFVLSLTVTFFLFGCQKKPEASFETDISTKYAGDEIKFTNTTVEGYSFLWDFGDGETSEEINPVHVFKDKGDYIVKLTAFSENRKKSDFVSESVRIFKKKEIIINNEIYPIDKGYLVDYDDNNYFDLFLVNSNIYVSPIIEFYVYDRNNQGNILEVTLESPETGILDEGIYTPSGHKVFRRSEMMVGIQYFSGDYLYYECYSGTAEIGIIGDTYEIEIEMTTTGGENVSVYYLGHLTKYIGRKKKEFEILQDVKLLNKK